MSEPVRELVGTPLFKDCGLHSSERMVVKAVDVTDVCPPKGGYRTLIAYGGESNGRHVAFIVCSVRDPLDGVCKIMRLDELFGMSRGASRKELYRFASAHGVHLSTLVMLANNHQPP